MPNAYVGISGWTYRGWRERFYPPGLAHRRELEFASRQFNAIEINGTFYSLQRPSSFEHWYAETPDGFRFAVKGSRFITHMKQLNDVQTALANFLASGVLLLEDKLGPMLWQFPARMRFRPDRFARFLEILPRTASAAARIARGHDQRLDGRAAWHVEADRPLRHAFEVRNDSFMCDAFIDLLRLHGAALVFSDAAAEWPYAEDLTAPFVYLRLHGAEELYASGYGDASLERWASRVRAWMAGTEPADAVHAATAAPPPAAQPAAVQPQQRDAWVFFDNDAKVHAPFDAMDLAWKLGSNWRWEHEQ